MGETGNTSGKGVVLVICTMASFFTPFMGSAVNIALPAIGREFGMNAVALSWVATSFLLAAAMFLVPFGRLADIYGRKNIFTWGIVLYTVSCLLLGLSVSSAMLIAFRVLQGIASAMMFGTAVAILTSVFPPSERGKALGINVAAVYTGLSIGPPVGGFLTERLGWQSIFLTNVPLGLIVLGAVLWKLRGEWAEARGERFDLAGSTVYGVSLAALMYGFSRLPAVSGIWLVVAGITGVLAFVIWETRVKNPVLNIRLFHNNKAFSFSSLAALINYSATFAVGFLLSLYLQYIKGFSPERAGLILVSQPVIMATLSPLAGRLSDRVEPRLLASGGMALSAVGLALLISLNQDTQIAFILIALVILGLGFALFSSPNTNAIMSSVERKFYGVASGILGTMRLTGQMLSLGITTLLFALFIGRVQITPEFYPSFLKVTRVAFSLFAALCFAGVFASLARGKTHEDTTQGGP